MERQLSADDCILGDGFVAFIAEGVQILTKSGFHLCRARRLSSFLFGSFDNAKQILGRDKVNESVISCKTAIAILMGMKCVAIHLPKGLSYSAHQSNATAWPPLLYSLPTLCSDLAVLWLHPSHKMHQGQQQRVSQFL